MAQGSWRQLICEVFSLQAENRGKDNEESNKIF